MPRKSNKTDGATMRFTLFGGVTLVAGVGAVVMQCNNNNLSPRMVNEADAWALWRLKALRYRLRHATTLTGVQGMCYIAGVTDAGPGTVTALSENHAYTVLMPTDTVPSPWVKVPKALLGGYEVWYKTVPGSPETADEQPGAIFLAGTGTDVVSYEVDFTIEFRDAVNTGSTPAELMLRASLRENAAQRRAAEERRRLLLVLNPAPLSAVSVTPGGRVVVNPNY